MRGESEVSMKTEISVKVPQLVGSGANWMPSEVAHVELSAEGVPGCGDDAVAVLAVRDTTGQLVSMTHVSLCSLKSAVEALVGVVL